MIGAYNRPVPKRVRFGRDVPPEVERLKLAVSLAQEVGQAWRGDWSNFDGRTLRGEMDDLQEVVSGKWDAARYRATNGLCPHGRGHWTDYCSTYSCDQLASGEVSS